MTRFAAGKGRESAYGWPRPAASSPARPSLFVGMVLGLILGGSLFLPTTDSAIVGGAASSRTYTLDADFDEGVLININHDAPSSNQLRLNEGGEPFNFIWVAASGRGTIIKIDTLTGAILGEYWSAPDGRGRDPSRTTVEANGNVWAGNRAEGSDGMGSVVRVGLLENGQCQDRNGDGTIETSAGVGDIRPWTNTGGVDNLGGVSTAQDECIINYARVAGTAARTLAIDSNNDIWVGGWGDQDHEKLDDLTGLPVPSTQFNLGCGGYGGLIDGNDVLWSASLFLDVVLRYDTVAGTGACLPLPGTSYGLGIDSNGNIWHTHYCYNTVSKIDLAGNIIGTFPTGGGGCGRGVAVTPADNNVWVANSGGADVSRLDNHGNLLKVIPVGTFPTGVSVDAVGKVWVTNYVSNNVMRINPVGGGDGLGAVDLTVDLGAGASPYNYSDMTGSTLSPAPDDGTWTVVYDGGVVGIEWGTITWASLEPDDSSIAVFASSSSDGTTFGSEQPVTDGADLQVDNGQYLRVRASFQRASTGGSPILYDLTISSVQPPSPMQIDIKPGSFPNSINLSAKGVIPVAILGSSIFDATQVDPATVLFAGTGMATNPKGKLQAAIEDVNGDGYPDLIMHFPTQSTNIQADDTEACLTGQTLGGALISGCDSVRIVPPGTDSDGSGFDDSIEASVGTNQFAACGAGAWPPDFNEDGRVLLNDVLQYVPVIGTSLGDGPYASRFDLSGDGLIGLPDVLRFIPVFGKTCS